MVHLFLEHGVVFDVLVVLKVGVAELAGVSGLPLKNEGLLVHGGDGGIEGFDGLVEYPLHVDVLLGFGEEAELRKGNEKVLANRGADLHFNEWELG